MLLMNTTTVYKSDDPPSGEQLMKSNWAEILAILRNATRIKKSHLIFTFNVFNVLLKRFDLRLKYCSIFAFIYIKLAKKILLNFDNALE
jgi:hypothetical protein